MILVRVRARALPFTDAYGCCFALRRTAKSAHLLHARTPAVCGRLCPYQIGGLPLPPRMHPARTRLTRLVVGQVSEALRCEECAECIECPAKDSAQRPVRPASFFSHRSRLSPELAKANAEFARHAQALAEVESQIQGATQRTHTPRSVARLPVRAVRSPHDLL
jgi:hypothetical protein